MLIEICMLVGLVLQAIYLVHDWKRK
jgi:hypothetical protein